MPDVSIIAWSSCVIVGTLIVGSTVHYFRCNSSESFKYTDGAALSYYCPTISGAEAEAIVEELERSSSTRSPYPYPVNPDDQLGDSGVNSKPSEILLRLGKHDVYRDQITLSGFSSGGTFAQQMFIAYSSMFTGIASFSHAYYRCGPGNGLEADYDNACTVIGTNVSYSPDLALNDIRMYERSGLIESTANLRNKKLYIYAGSRSEFFSLDQSLGAVRVFEPLIRDTCKIRTKVQDAAQLLPTDKYGLTCTMSANQNLFVGNCGFSGALDALQFLYNENAIRAPAEMTRPRLNQLLTFDQTEFFYGYTGPEYMDPQGYIYVPRQCHRQRCYLHFYFHGCLTGREFNGTDHIASSGFMEVAEANNLIVVFPQARSSLPENMIGCWDTYGLTGQLYATTQGPQITVVRNMIARILGIDNAIVPDARRNVREREPLGIEFEIVKGREVYLRR